MATATKDAQQRNQDYQALEWDKRLEAYKNDKEAAQVEVGRSKNVFMDNPNDATRQKGAHDWAEQVRTSAGIALDDPTYGNGVNSPSRITAGNPTETNKMSNENPVNNATDFVGYMNNNKPAPLSTYNPTFTPGQKTDLSPLMNAIQQYKPGSTPFNMDQLKTYMDKVSSTGSADRTFKLGDLQTAIGDAAKAGGAAPGVRDAKLQSPEQIAALIQSMKTAMDPLTQQQKGAATSGYNAQSQKLRDQWASRGMLASGAAAAQEMEGAQGLAGQLAGIEAQAQASAIPLAFQGAQLGLQEDQQIFGQKSANRNFDAGQAQNKVGNLLSGMSAEGSQRGQDLQASQQNVANQLSALGMQQSQIQQYLGNMQGAKQMEMGQDQWSQNFGLQQQGADFNRWATTQGMNQQANSQWMGQLAQGLGMQESARQFDTSTANQQKQQNIGNAINLSQLSGSFVAPKDSGQALFDQVLGKDTLAGSAQNSQNQSQQNQTLMQLAQMFGNMPKGAGSQNIQDILQTLAGQNTLGQNQQNWNQSQATQQVNFGKATNAIMANALSFTDMDQAIKYIVNNSEQIANDGANIQQVLGALQTKFAQKNTPQAPTGMTEQEVTLKAIEAAHDSGEWMKAGGDPAKEQAIIDRYKTMIQGSGTQTAGK